VRGVGDFYQEGTQSDRLVNGIVCVEGFGFRERSELELRHGCQLCARLRMMVVGGTWMSTRRRGRAH